jgi:hypothetical protein
MHHSSGAEEHHSVNALPVSMPLCMLGDLQARLIGQAASCICDIIEHIQQYANVSQKPYETGAFSDHSGLIENRVGNCS